MKINKKQQSQIASILCYFIIGWFWYLFDENIKKSKLVKFHVKQSLNLFIIYFAISTISTYIFMPTLNFLGEIQQIGQAIAAVFLVIFGILHLILFLLWIYGIINSIQERCIKIPFIGRYAEKYLRF